MEKLLEIKDIFANADKKEILKGLNLVINKGETHVIMGPNGAGKSTLANVILNKPAYTKQSGKILFDDVDITDLRTDQIARQGIFMSFQQPVEIEGISFFDFVKTAKASIDGKPVSYFEFKDKFEALMEKLGISKEFENRDLNVGFSGGEKKKAEILQLLALEPKLAILDETDSGLDVDAIKIVSRGVEMFKNENNAVLIITHSSKMLENLKPDYVHILVDGKIVETAGAELVEKIEKYGYADYKSVNQITGDENE